MGDPPILPEHVMNVSLAEPFKGVTGTGAQAPHAREFHEGFVPISCGASVWAREEP